MSFSFVAVKADTFAVADLYIVLFDAIRKDPSVPGHGREGFYFGENGEHNMYEVGKAIGDALVALGKSATPDPTPFTNEENQKYFGVSIGASDFSWPNERLNLNFYAGHLPRDKFTRTRKSFQGYWLETHQDQG